MSISEFTAALRSNADKSLTDKAQKLLDSFARNATAAFDAGGMRRAGSILSEGTVTIKGKQVKLSGEFRRAGERQGRTRLILTEDDLQSIFNNYNIVATVPPIVMYAKFLAATFPKKMARHFEIYLRDGSVIERGKLPISDVINSIKDITTIVAIRGLNFSHENTVVHVAHFLHYTGVFPGESRKDIEKKLTGDYDRGHVYAQTYGRALISLGDLANEENILADILKLYQLLDEGSSSLTRLDGKYNTLLARSKKDFSSKNLAMNIQLQLKRDVTGTGNRDTGDLSSYVRIVGFLQNLIKNSKLSSDGKRQLGQPAAESLKQFEKALTDLNNKLEKYSKEIANVISRSNEPNFLVTLRTSDNVPEYVSSALVAILEGKKPKTLKVTTPNIQVKRSAPLKTKIASPLSKVLPSLNKMKTDLSKAKKDLSVRKVPKIVSGTAGSSNLVSLLSLLQSAIAQQVKQNMGTGSAKNVLNLQTGRFAESVKVERLSESRAGMITAFYTYMRNPYGTFSEGGKQEFPRTRDPKLLISKSIREIAATQVGNRLRAVLV